jgi:hypothetical protein
MRIIRELGQPARMPAWARVRASRAMNSIGSSMTPPAARGGVTERKEDQWIS